MSALLCICNGMIRSGSTWSFNVCRALTAEMGRQINRPSGSAYLEAAQFEHLLLNQLASLPGPTAVKAHEIGPTAMSAIRTGVAKCICTFRDPRDCVASDLIFLKQGVQTSVQRVIYTLNFLQQFETSDNLLLIRYENLMNNPRLEIARMAEHLGVSITPAMVEKIDTQTNFEATRQSIDQLKNRPQSELLNIAGHRIDPITHLHENHLNGGLIGRWKTELPALVCRQLNNTFAPWLIKLGYETDQSLAAM